MKSAKKFILFIIILLIAVIIIGIILLYYNKPVSYDGIIHAGVESKIIIHRDKNGIPFIKAGNMNDAYFAVGFLHCQDRQFLIEYFRAVATGRLSELIGNAGIFMDKLSLTIGFAREAENIISRLNSPYYDYLNSYVRGINASRKASGAGSLSRFSLKDWAINDVVSILLLFDWADAFQNNKELIFPVPDKLNRYLKEIIPQNLLFQYRDEEKNSLDLLIKIREAVKNHVGLFQAGFAYYLDSRNLKDGKAVSGFTLDSDMGIYPKWYPMSLMVGDRKIDCVTASGLPFLLFGRNEKISFFGFNLHVDTQDFRIERVGVIKNAEKYYRNGAWHNFKIINEKIYSKDINDVDKYSDLAVRYTDNGPIISDIISKENNLYCFSINSILPDESYINALFNIPFAESIREAYNFIRNTGSIPKSYLFGSRDDVICAYSGRMFKNNGKEIFQKDNSAAAKSAINLSAFSKCYNNRNIIVGDDVFEGLPTFIRNEGIHNGYDRSIGSERSIRFRELIASKKPVDPEDIALILKDTHSAAAEKFIPLFLPILDQFPIPSAKLCRIYFEDWNYNMDPGSVASTIFEVLLINMLKETIADETGDVSMLMNNYSLLIDNLYTLMFNGNSPIFDDITTKENIETRDVIFGRAFIKTLKILNEQSGPIMDDWKWGKLHRERIIIPLLKDPLLNYRYSRRDHVEVPGGNNTVMKGSVNALNLLKPVTVSVISGIFYMDLNLFFITNSISQSLIPSSEFYRDLSANGDFVSIDTSDLLYTFTILPENN